MTGDIRMKCSLHVESIWINYCPFAFTLFCLIFCMFLSLIDPKSVCQCIKLPPYMSSTTLYLIPLCWRYFDYSLLLLYSNLCFLLSGFSGELLFWDFSLSSLWTYHWILVLGIPFPSHFLFHSRRVCLLVASRERENGRWISQILFREARLILVFNIKITDRAQTFHNCRKWWSTYAGVSASSS